MRALVLAGAPGSQVGAVGVEHDDRRVFALEDVDAVLRVGGYEADEAEFLAVGEFEEVGDEVVGVVACAELGHWCFPPGEMSTKVALSVLATVTPSHAPIQVPIR